MIKAGVPAVAAPVLLCRIRISRPMSAIRRFAHGLVAAGLTKLGYRLVREDRIPVATLELFDLGLRLLAARGRPLTLLQVGANDGVTNDPVYPYVHHEWLSGVLVEPVPDSYARLCHSYRGYPDRFKCINAAVADYCGTVELYLPSADDGCGLAQKASARRDHLERHGQQDRRVRAITVPCYTIMKLLDATMRQPPDVLVIDAEGWDWKILRNAFSDGVEPAMIYAEIVHLAARERTDMRAQLTARGYRFAETTKDCLALKCEVLAGAAVAIHGLDSGVPAGMTASRWPGP